ncbi:MAG: GRP family sugar transporter [Solirubrobacteraceae bacterium]
MTALLALTTVATWGVWIPLAQIVPGISQRSRTFYVTVGNLVFAGLALLIAGGHLAFGWRTFWFPIAGGLLWTAGNFSAFRASETIGLARAAGTWTPLNVIVAFVWGAVLFGELDHIAGAHLAALAAALMLILVGVRFIMGSQNTQAAATPTPAVVAARETPPSESALARPVTPVSAVAIMSRAGWLWAGAAGVLWGSYFVPAQWAKVPAQVSNLPLALGIFAAGLALALPAREPARLSLPVSTIQIAAGLLFGIGNLALLGLISRVGTGVGFTIAQLSLLVNASIGIWIFKVPEPGSHAARVALTGILIAGVGGCIIGAMR